MPRSKDRGRFRPSTRRIRFARASSRSAPSWCSARITFRSRFPASPAAISPRRLRRAIPSSRKAHPLHPGTGRLLAEAAVAALRETGLPPATVQMIYKIDHQSGQRLVSDSRVGASAFTGSRAAGMALKNAADAVGKPIYLEMSSINPVVILPGALAERGSKVAADFASSCLMGGGQFCTNAGFVLLFADARTDQFIDEVKSAFDAAQPPALLSEGVAKGLADSVKTLRSAGADLLTAPGAGANGRAPSEYAAAGDGKTVSCRAREIADGGVRLCVAVRRRARRRRSRSGAVAPRRQSHRLHLFRHPGQRRRVCTRVWRRRFAGGSADC